MFKSFVLSKINKMLNKNVNNDVDQYLQSSAFFNDINCQLVNPPVT